MSNVVTPGASLDELIANETFLGLKTRTVGELATAVSNVKLNDWHCDKLPLSVYGKAGGLSPPDGTHDESSEGWIFMTSETFAVLWPLASSREATNVVPLANGRNVTAAPVLVASFHAVLGIDIFWTLVEAKGTTVNVRGNADGALPPAKEMLKEPHCEIEEKVMESNLARTTCGP